MHTAIVKPEWSPVTIALMVLGFIVFWPLGLAMLAYILWGEYFGGSSEKAESWVRKQKDWARNRRHRHGNWQMSGNAAFDDYRSEQLKRLEEERRRLDEEVREFQDYMHNLRKARDREEFDRFMRDRRAPRDEFRQDSPGDEHRQGY
jgi:hypothetical protein